VGYFVSYYDYYQPEAYMPVSDTYIEKDLSINESWINYGYRQLSIAHGRRDIIVVASVSCIYGIGNPKDFAEGVVRIKEGQSITAGFLHSLVNGLYSRTQAILRGDVSGERRYR
jgi:excinuclease ABC subunit B